MLSHAFCLAREEFLRQCLEAGLQIEYDDIEVRIKAGELLNLNVKLKSLTSEQVFCIENYYKFSNEVSEMLERPNAPKTYEESCALYLIQTELDQKMLTLSMNQGRIFYAYNKSIYCLTLESEQARPAWQNYETLMLCEAIFQGMTFQEVRGSHFNIYSLKDPIRATTLSNCSCGEFERSRDCIHVRAVSALQTRRRACARLLAPIS